MCFVVSQYNHKSDVAEYEKKFAAEHDRAEKVFVFLFLIAFVDLFRQLVLKFLFLFAG